MPSPRGSLNTKLQSWSDVAESVAEFQSPEFHVRPYPNEEAARYANGGANPPDLSVACLVF